MAIEFVDPYRFSGCYLPGRPRTFVKEAALRAEANNIIIDYKGNFARVTTYLANGTETTEFLGLEAVRTKLHLVGMVFDRNSRLVDAAVIDEARRDPDDPGRTTSSSERDAYAAVLFGDLPEASAHDLFPSLA